MVAGGKRADKLAPTGRRSGSAIRPGAGLRRVKRNIVMPPDPSIPSWPYIQLQTEIVSEKWKMQAAYIAESVRKVTGSRKNVPESSFKSDKTSIFFDS